ncbi:MAG TPA: Ca2+-dependent phosphoinositide-specific phospholipase C [Pirellulaceae bacterium]|nr:Ca2+-dependent phosphoinositide-specific phospholipase C [Pirellulaceae bacterium]
MAQRTFDSRLTSTSGPLSRHLARPSLKRRRGVVAIGAACCALFASALANLAPTPTPALAQQPDADSLRLDQVQVLGTHNSYHVAPDEVAAGLIRAFAPQEAEANDYSHRPLVEQLDRLRVRQFELDLFLDPDGGRYSQPMAMKLARERRVEVPPHDPDGLLAKPGIKILHSPDVEFRTTVYSLADSLRMLKKWSDEHPGHFPVFLLLELKSESFSPFIRPPKWDWEACQRLEREVLEQLPRERLLVPDDVRGDAATLRDAVAGRGWPTVRAARGKFVLLLDNEDSVRAAYLKPSDTLAGRLLFVSVDRRHPAAAWMKRNDPIGSAAEITSLVRDGFLVRTRADAGTVEARKGDVRRRDQALATGAQLISTDFPEPDPRWPGYSVTWPDGREFRRR